MIRKKAIRCKLFQLDSSPKLRFQRFMKNFRPEQEACPFCGASGSCQIHGYYERSLIGFCDGRPVYDRIRVMRLICRSCRHTHAVLPDFIIPYAQYSLDFVIRVLHAHLDSSATVREICERFAITPAILYSWKALYLEHRKLALGVLTAAVEIPGKLLLSLIRDPDLSGFLHRFSLKWNRSFLQGHP